MRWCWMTCERKSEGGCGAGTVFQTWHGVKRIHCNFHIKWHTRYISSCSDQNVDLNYKSFRLSFSIPLANAQWIRKYVEPMSQPLLIKSELHFTVAAKLDTSLQSKKTEIENTQRERERHCEASTYDYALMNLIPWYEHGSCIHTHSSWVTAKWHDKNGTNRKILAFRFCGCVCIRFCHFGWASEREKQRKRAEFL